MSSSKFEISALDANSRIYGICACISTLVIATDEDTGRINLSRLITGDLEDAKFLRGTSLCF